MMMMMIGPRTDQMRAVLWRLGGTRTNTFLQRCNKRWDENLKKRKERGENLKKKRL